MLISEKFGNLLTIEGKSSHEHNFPSKRYILFGATLVTTNQEGNRGRVSALLGQSSKEKISEFFRKLAPMAIFDKIMSKHLILNSIFIQTSKQNCQTKILTVILADLICIFNLT